MLAGVGMVALTAAYAVALWRMPDWMHQHDPKDRHNARLLVVSAGGAVVVTVSLLYTARSYRLSHRGQVTDRFAKAVERLGSANIEARLGGLHALGHVASDSRTHHDDVVEVLESFIRHRASEARLDQGGPSLGRRPALTDRPDSDVQAALTALGRRPHRPERRQVDLSGLHLTTARLAGLALGSMNLRRTDLRGATLHDADLRGANLREACLKHANLKRADLEGADLRDTDLQIAYLHCAALHRADLRGADLQEADLRGADLRGADLRGAHLQRAALKDADLRDANLLNVDLKDADLAGADLRGANLHGTDLECADLRGADLREIIGRSEQQLRSMATTDKRTRFGAVQ
ncbi:pentapeptide repeat-containing protein [Spirillospora sp. CA-108201]